MSLYLSPVLKCFLFRIYVNEPIPNLESDFEVAVIVDLRRLPLSSLINSNCSIDSAFLLQYQTPMIDMWFDYLKMVCILIVTHLSEARDGVRNRDDGYHYR